MLPSRYATVFRFCPKDHNRPVSNVVTYRHWLLKITAKSKNMTTKADKLAKKALMEGRKRFKPAECQKYIRMVLDENILNTKLGKELLKLLMSETTVQWTFEVRSLPEPDCVIWERNIGQRTLVTSNAASALNAEWEMESEVIRLVHMQQLEQADRDGKLAEPGERMRAAFPGRRYTLLVLMEEDKRIAFTRINLHLQLVQEVFIQESSPDAQGVMDMLKCFTKAVAEIPYKKEQQELLQCFKPYMGMDKIRCVKVDGVNGMRRLWQLHLMCVPLLTLEIAETIMEKFSCLKKLLAEYENNSNAVEDIANLRIRRSGAQTTQKTDRRIGRALSEKLYKVYMSDDPNEVL